MKKLTILLFAATALAAGCKKFTENINTNPNQPTVVTPNVLLSASLNSSAANLALDFQNTARWMGYWSRSGSYIEDVPTETYDIQPSYADGSWQSLYAVLTQYKGVEAAAGSDPFYSGVAKIMEALHFSTLVDGFNNVPYSQAFNLNKYPNPKYDDAATVYAALVQQCDSAVYYFQKAIVYYGTAPSTVVSTDATYDIVYGRSALALSATQRMDYWIKFANTVKLKLLMTARGSSASAFSASSITTELAKVTATGQGYIGSDYAGGGIAYDVAANESASVNPGYGTANAAQQNPFFGSFYVPSGTPNNNLAYYRANTYYVNYGNNFSDFRFTDDYLINLGGAPYVTGNYDGDPNAVSNSLSSQLGQSTVPTTIGPLHSSAQDEFLMSDFESLFWQAEAASLGYNVGTLTSGKLADIGTEQSFVYVDDTGSGSASQDAADAETNFIAGTAGTIVDISTSTPTLRAIMTEKWSALNSINWEQAYTDYRRTGYPVPDGTNFGFSHAQNRVTHSSKDALGNVQSVNLPYRYLYPQSEINTNAGNIPAGTSAYTKIFWDNREQ